MNLPLATANLVGFARTLRAAGIPVAPEQAVTFLRAVTLIGPRSIDDIREAALSTLGPDPDHRAAFEALFRAWFFGEVDLVASGEADDETRVKDDRGGRDEVPAPLEAAEGGEIASTVEQLATRHFTAEAWTDAKLGRALEQGLPRRRSLRSVRAASCGQPDLRRSLRSIVQSDGDIPSPLLRRRPLVQRRLLLLIDISGSMKLHTADHLKLAHAIVQGADRVEVFTLGTRLTRITTALRTANCDLALARAAETVEDWDGGTRIGPTLLAFLSVPRFAAMARGAATVILSDGLERGSHAEMEQAFRRLKARAFRLSLCTPLAADVRFRPQTAALKAVLPWLDDLADGSSSETLIPFILSLARPVRKAIEIWREAS